MADQLRDRGFAVFGPGADGARLEGSKAFAKEVMEAAGVPTGRAATFTDYDQALAYLRKHGAPVVVKADGLAAGKGVIVAQTLEEAEAALEECFVERRFGSAANLVLIEEYLEGEEVSLLSIVSGTPDPASGSRPGLQAHLRRRRGPQHGWDGIVLPGPAVDDALYARLVDDVVRPTVAEIASAGHRLPGMSLRWADADGRRPQGARVQLPLRRSGDAGPPAPAGVGSAGAAVGGGPGRATPGRR